MTSPHPKVQISHHINLKVLLRTKTLGKEGRAERKGRELTPSFPPGPELGPPPGPSF